LPILDPLDRQFLELGRVCLLRYLHFLPSKSDSILGHPWQTKFRGKLNQFNQRETSGFLMMRRVMECHGFLLWLRV
ncbi:MAG: hypothetical protein LWW81_04560, partial [Rhodocyclales bacterium]|nr:hypothetical protein [Rhodocyclales bacterium]